MDPEIEVDITEECEDLNTQIISMDRSSDSPHPPSPRQGAALDEAIARTDINNNELDFDPITSVLTEMLSTQPETPPARRPRESRSRRRTSRHREDTREVILMESTRARDRMDEVTDATSPIGSRQGSTPPLTSHGFRPRHGRGRGLLCLPAPPKLGRTPAPGSRSSQYGKLTASQWAIPVPQAPIFEFTASTPPLEDSQVFTSQSETSQFQDADEDYRPLTGTWGDIVEREEQAAQSAAAAAVSTALATPPEPVAAINAQSSIVSTTQATVTRPDEPTPATPMSIASLLLSHSTPVAETTVTSSSKPAGIPATVSVPPTTVAETAPDMRRFLQDADITYAVRLAPTPDAEATTDALLVSFQSATPRDQLLHIVQLLFDIQRDTSVLLMERITVARLTDQTSDDILDEVIRLLRRFIRDTRCQ